jgi:hypothetical protein
MDLTIRLISLYLIEETQAIFIPQQLNRMPLINIFSFFVTRCVRNTLKMPCIVACSLFMFSEARVTIMCNTHTDAKLKIRMKPGF